jgi:hypothetical protein
LQINLGWARLDEFGKAVDHMQPDCQLLGDPLIGIMTGTPSVSPFLYQKSHLSPEKIIIAKSFTPISTTPPIMEQPKRDRKGKSRVYIWIYDICINIYGLKAEIQPSAMSVFCIYIFIY